MTTLVDAATIAQSAEGLDWTTTLVSTNNTCNGSVYLIHFDQKYGRSGHYLGWSSCLPARMTAHSRGQGARLMEVIKDAGITWRLVRVWSGDRTLERALKNRKQASVFCPTCDAQHSSA